MMARARVSRRAPRMVFISHRGGGNAPITGTVSLGTGVDSGTVTGLGLASVPARVFVAVSSPNGLFVMARVVRGSESADGFGFELSGVTDHGDHKLDYQIVL